MTTLLTPQFFALLPLLITSATVVLVMLFISVKRHHWWNATLTVTGLNLALLAAFYATVLAATLALQPQPQPITITPLLVMDPFACVFTILILVSTLACATLMHAYLEGYPGNKEEMYLLLTLSAAGAIVLVMSHHLAGFFIGLELLSVPVYGMAAYAFRHQRSLEAGIKYMVLSAAASAFILFGMALLYAESGTLTFEGLGMMLAMQHSNSALVLVATGLILVGVGFKLSLAPFHLWTPDVYEGAPAPVTAYLATVSKVAVFAVFLRLLMVTPIVHHQFMPALNVVLSAIALVSIVVGNLLALKQTNIKRLLAYSSIAHLGYLLIALVAGTVGAIITVEIYLITYVVTTLAAFGVITLMSSPYQGKDADALHDYRGLFWRRPYLTAVLTVSMLSLAGIPMTAGFIGKFYIALIGVSAQKWWLLGALVGGSAIGLYYYLRVVVTLFLPTPGMQRYDAPANWGRVSGGFMVLGLAGLTLFLGFMPQFAVNIVNNIGRLMMSAF